MQCQSCGESTDEAEFDFDTFNCNGCQEYIDDENKEDELICETVADLGLGKDGFGKDLN